jgi:hypothetical protein
MTTFDEVEAAIQALPRERAPAFAAACATRLAPIVSGFGSSAAVAAYDAATDTLWRGDGASVDALVERLEAAPEADEDDSHVSSYEVMRALSVPAMGLELLRDGDATEVAEQVAGAAADIAAALDAYLGASGGIEQAELADQLSQLRRLREPDVSLDAMNSEAQAAADRVAGVLGDVADRQGWLLSTDDQGG